MQTQLKDISKRQLWFLFILLRAGKKILGPLPLFISKNLLHKFRYWVDFWAFFPCIVAFFLQVWNKNNSRPNTNPNPNPNPNPNSDLTLILTVYRLLSFIGVTILRRDISPVGFKKSNHQGNVVCKLPQFLIFEKYPIYIGKRQLRLIFIIWHTGKKWYWLQHTSVLPRTYCITLHI